MNSHFLIGWLLGFAFWAYSISWIYDAINFYGAGTVLSSTITFLLIAYLSVYFGIFLVAINYFKDHQYKFLMIPSAFFLLEWLRSWVISGFPWLNLGVLSESLWGVLPVIGVAGTSFLIILVIALLLERNKKIISRITASLILLLLFFGPGHYQEGGEEKLKITVLQPLDTNIADIIKMTNDANSDLVVWPEAVTVYDENISMLIPEKEVAFNKTFTDRVKGTKYIIHMSNDKWYGESMPAQHLQHAKARAVESNKWVVRATLDGISQIISPRSNESSKSLDRGEKGSITHEISLNDIDTFYLKHGDVPLLIISILSLIFGLYSRKNEK